MPEPIISIDPTLTQQRAASEATDKEIDYPWKNKFIDTIHAQIEQGEVMVTESEATNYVSECMKDTFPQSTRTYISDDTSHVTISSEKAAEEAEETINQMEGLYHNYLIIMLSLQEVLKGGDPEEAKRRYYNKTSLLGPQMEENFWYRTAINDLTETDKTIMQALSSYRTFVLAQEVCTASRQHRAVNADLVTKLWEAKNVRISAIERSKGNNNK